MSHSTTLAACQEEEILKIVLFLRSIFRISNINSSLGGENNSNAVAHMCLETHWFFIPNMNFRFGYLSIFAHRYFIEKMQAVAVGV